MIYLGIFIFLVALLSLYRKKASKKRQEVDEHFLEREAAANNIRRQDISGLPYITIHLDKFPIGNFKDEELSHYESVLEALSERQILNLGTLTNTDLKLQYGPANLDILTDCEQRFITLCQTLISYAERLLALGHTAEAQTVLEFGISCGSDISRNYLLLAGIYRESGRQEQIKELIREAEKLDSMMKNSILKHLNELLLQ